MYKAIRLSPMVPSYDLSKTRDFFKKMLGFEVIIDTPEYCIVSLNGYELHLQKVGANIAQMSFYLSVDNINAVWDRLKDKKEELKIREPFEQPYGMKEIHVIVPQTEALMFIGQPIAAS